MDIPFGKHNEFQQQFSGYELSKEYSGKKKGITPSVNLLAPELFFFILAHPVYKIE